MLALINPAALPALRIAATFFLTVNILAFVYILDKDPNVAGDIPTVRRLRVEVILIPWCSKTQGPTLEASRHRARQAQSHRKGTRNLTGCEISGIVESASRLKSQIFCEMSGSGSLRKK